MWPFSKKPAPITETTTTHADGSRTTTTTMQLTADGLRPVDDDVVAAYDDALESLGGQVMHAIDPKRIMSFAAGGPATWSVGMTTVPGPVPYTLLLTYGLSHALSPEPARAAFDFEYSLALPAHIQPNPWADALLRHLGRYVVSQRPLAVDDGMPLNAPITCSPFPPPHHHLMPKTELTGIVVAVDPVLPVIPTPRGKVHVRRLLGVHHRELVSALGQPPGAWLGAYAGRDRLLLTDLARPAT